MGELYDAPNQQVVRPDGSGPWDEGEGGSTHDDQPAPQAQPTTEPQQQEEEPAKAEPQPIKPATRRKDPPK